MPGRQFGQGENFPGVLVNGTTTVNGYTIPIDLSITGRVSGEAAEYVASNSVEFGGEFESSVSDEFTSYIADGTYAGTGNQVTGGGAYGTAGRYRYGFGGQEMSNEIKGVGNSYTAEFWEYDPRVGRRWNIDPVNIGGTSGYNAFANNPIIFVDPLGLDTVRSSGGAKTGDVFQHQNGNSNFFWNKTADGWEGGGSSSNLDEVVVTGKRKSVGRNYFNWPAMNAKQGMWNDKMFGRIRDNQALQQSGDPSWLAGQLQFHQHNYKMEQESRAVQGFAVGVIAAPIVGVALAESGAAYYASNFLSRPFLAATGRYGATLKVAAWMQIGNAGADLTYQTIKWSITGDGINLGSTFGNLYFKNPLLSSLPGAIVKPEGNFLNTWGRGALGDAIGNIPIPGVKIGTRLGMEGFTMPLIGNLSSDVITGQFK